MDLILAAHGNLAIEMKNTAELIMGKQENLFTVSFVPGENTQSLKEKYEKICMEADSEKETLIIVDLFGGSPYNAAFEIAFLKENREVVTGMSVPMVLEILSKREEPGINIKNILEGLHKENYIVSAKSAVIEGQEIDEEEL